MENRRTENCEAKREEFEKHIKSETENFSNHVEAAQQSMQSQMKGRPGIPGSIEQPKSAFRDASKERRDRLAKEEAEKAAKEAAYRKAKSQEEPDESMED